MSINYPSTVRARVGRIIVAVVSAPALVFGMLALALLGLLGAVGCLRVGQSGAYAIDATWRPWVARWWRYSTTIGLTVIYHPEHVGFGRIERHEAVHVRQHQDHGFLGAALALAVVWWSWEAALVLWCASPLFSAPCWLTAWLRGGDAYRDAEHERSAYGQVASGLDIPGQS